MESKEFQYNLEREGFRNPRDRTERMLVLIALLKYKRRKNLDQLATLLGKSTRQLRRDIKSLERFFDLDYDEYNRPFIFADKDDNGIFINVTDEEMSLLAQLVDGVNHKLKDGLIKKLDRNLFLDFKLKTDLAQLVNQIKYARRNKRCILIEGYQGAKDKEPKDVELEPVNIVDLKYLSAFDPVSGINKIYALERITGGIKVLEKEISNEEKHRHQQPDVFGIITGEVHQVKLTLSNRAYLLLKEEYPRSVQFIHKSKNEDYPWLFETNVYGLQGIGRFVLGLIDELEIEECNALEDYVMQKMDEWKTSLNEKDA
jgi:predicted DNA-binding transcriptional regulator YafY